MKTTVREVARRAGVSPMTVSRVLNRQDGVREATRRRVEEALAALGHVSTPAPAPASRGSLPAPKTGTIGLVVPDVANPFFALVLRSAEQAARRADHRLLVCSTDGDLGLEREHVQDLLAHRVEGLIVAPCGDRSAAHLRPVVASGVPLVLLDRAIEGFEADLVQGDSAAGARRLVDHLVAVGHRRIAMILGPDDVSTTRERLAGTRAALAAAGLALPPELLARTTVDRLGGQRAMQQLLGLAERPSAVFAVNNMTALGAMQAIREHGLAVPQDIALVCFDDVEHLAVLAPFMTVVDQPAEAFGTLAAQMLLERIAGTAGDRPRVVRLQPTLIVRASCGAGTARPR